ncbi:hypothetical protein Spb1_26690 [Planctopirus ephydatiae]|uniref:Uncharacterized protein n=1 Tax=Planctopirus ephydatiae TaxID=2528019 RepID=A0A518GQ36_9PLAN|nr:hypothetical protein [Planctopirus ephydatiae]QDV30735.1 hypothetical protein Spb1_26690 [Planctopirus ephydatiae]
MSDQPSELPGSTTAQTMAHWLEPLLKRWLPHLVAAQLILLLFTKIAGIVALVCWLCELMPVVWGLAGLLIVLVISTGSLFFAIVLSLAMLEILRSDSADKGIPA